MEGDIKVIPLEEDLERMEVLFDAQQMYLAGLYSVSFIKEIANRLLDTEEERQKFYLDLGIES